MSTQAFYDPATGEVKAAYRNCRSASTAWGAFTEIETDQRVNVGDTITVVDGEVTSVTPAPPSPPLPVPTPEELLESEAQRLGFAGTKEFAQALETARTR